MVDFTMEVREYHRENPSLELVEFWVEIHNEMVRLLKGGSVER